MFEGYTLLQTWQWRFCLRLIFLKNNGKEWKCEKIIEILHRFKPVVLFLYKIVYCKLSAMIVNSIEISFCKKGYKSITNKDNSNLRQRKMHSLVLLNIPFKTPISYSVAFCKNCKSCYPKQTMCSNCCNYKWYEKKRGYKGLPVLSLILHLK